MITIAWQYYHFIIQKRSRHFIAKGTRSMTCETGTPLPRTQGENLPVADRAIRNPHDTTHRHGIQKRGLQEFLNDKFSYRSVLLKHQELQS